MIITNILDLVCFRSLRLLQIIITVMIRKYDACFAKSVKNGMLDNSLFKIENELCKMHDTVTSDHCNTYNKEV